jgi:hypothetical protein
MDRTGEVVSRIAVEDRRLRLVSGPPLPDGWCGKQFACSVLGGLASKPVLCFLDADVRLTPDGLTRISHGSLGLRKTRRRNQFFQVAMMTDDFYEVITEPSGRRKYFKRRKEIYFFVIRPLEGTAPQALRAEVSIFSTALRRPSVQRRRFVHTC